MRDFASRDLFAKILRDEEAHIDFLGRQFDLIGVQNRIQLSSEAAEAGAEAGS